MLSRLITLALLFTLGASHPTAAQPFAYVANLGSGDVSVIDLGADPATVSGVLPAGADPNGVAIGPDGSIAAVTNFASNQLTLIETTTPSVLSTVTVGTNPVGLAVHPDDRRVFVTERADSSVAIVDIDSGEVISREDVAAGPNAVAITPDGTQALATASFTKFPGIVTLLDVDGIASGSVAVQRNPNRVAISPDGALAYVTNFRSHTVSVLELPEATPLTTVRVSGRPTGIATNPNGSFLYVTTRDGFLQVIDLTNMRLHAKLGVGRHPTSIAVTRDGATGIVTNFGEDTVSLIDLAHHEVIGELAVGQRPFAAAIDCTGAACTAPPLTAIPTPTPSDTPTFPPTPTPSQTPTRTPTSTTTPTPELSGAEAVIRSSSTTVRPGDIALIHVTLSTADLQITDVWNSIRLAEPLRFRRTDQALVDCVRNTAIRKNDTSFIARGPCFEGRCSNAFAVVESDDHRDPIDDEARLYSCRIEVPHWAPQGSYLVEIYDPVALDPIGAGLEIFTYSGQITVSGAPRATSTPLPGSPTPTPTAARRTPPLNGNEVLVEASSPVLRPGRVGRVDFTLRTNGSSVAGVEFKIPLSESITAAFNQGELACSVNTDINRRQSAYSIKPSGCFTESTVESCDYIHFLLVDFEDLSPIADGSRLVTCFFNIPAAAVEGPHSLRPFEVGAAESSGAPLPAAGSGGEIFITDGPTPTPTASNLSVAAVDVRSNVDALVPGSTVELAFVARLYEPGALDRITSTWILPQPLAESLSGQDMLRCTSHPSETNTTARTAPSSCLDGQPGPCRSINLDIDFPADGSDRSVVTCTFPLAENARPGHYLIYPILVLPTGPAGSGARIDTSPQFFHYRGPPEVFIHGRDAIATPGGTFPLQVRFESTRADVAAIETEIHLPDGMYVPFGEGSALDCTTNPEIRRRQSQYAGQYTDDKGAHEVIKAIIIDFVDLNPIPAGTELFACNIEVSSDTPAGVYEIEFQASGASDAEGFEIAAGEGPNVRVEVVAPQATQSTTISYICAGGSTPGAPCLYDSECPNGACVFPASICAGGDDDGLTCECAQGTCSDVATTYGMRSLCVGGIHQGSSCNKELGCAGGGACNRTVRVCRSGVSKGIPCTADRHCVDSQCVEPPGRCLGGDFGRFSCVDDSDCPFSSCDPIAYRTRKPTKTSRPTRTPISPHERTRRPTLTGTALPLQTPGSDRTRKATKTARPTRTPIELEVRTRQPTPSAPPVARTEPPTTEPASPTPEAATPSPSATSEPTTPLPSPTATAQPSRTTGDAVRAYAAEDDGCAVAPVGEHSGNAWWLALAALLALGLRKPRTGTPAE